MRNKKIFNSPRILEIQKKKRRIRRNKILFLSISFLIFFLAISFVSRVPKWNVEGVEVAGNNIVDSVLIEEVAQEHLSGSYLWLIPKTNYLLIPKGSIRKELGERYKRLTDIKLGINNRKLSVGVAERTGVYTWCGDSLPPEGTLAEDTKCYFMDETGYIFDVAPYFSGDVYFKYFGSILDSQNPPGNTFLSEDFSVINSFKDTVAGMGVEPVAMHVKEGKVAEIYLTSDRMPPNSQKIIFNTDDDLVRLAENLSATLSSDALAGDIKKKYNSLEYIDLRFGNKVYYRFK
jgi:hypothetical protein